MKITLIIVLSTTFLLAQKSITSPHGGKLKIACESCHTTSDWSDVPRYKFNHDAVGYPLVGNHKFAECSSCHKSLIFSQVGIACADCHTDIHKGELGIQCADCHSSQNWENRRQVFEQHSQTNFPLIGVHANLDCASCHISEQQSQFIGLSVECQSCHLGNYMATLSPSHQKAGFDLDCQKCHLPNTTVWKTAIFEHPVTFPLNEGHSGLECADCHNSGFGSTNTDCYSCHKQDYEKTTEPNHSKFGFPTDCQQCHSGVSWERSQFDHFTESGFAIEGAHQGILCTDCHVGNQITGIARDCVGCHKQDFDNVSDPNHVENNFSLDCVICHNQNAWTPADFNHANTQFPLTGAHVPLDCVTCHSSGYQNTPTDCWSCHETDFTGVTDPNHVLDGFDHDCLVCHTTTVWEPTTNFDHNITNFPLTGAHTVVNCAVCHSSAFDNIPMECVACHLQDYNDTTDPNHSGAQFPNTCEDCHSTTAWSPANWDHDGQYFPIYSGAHKEKWNQCTDCHVNTNNYSQFDCTTCHIHRQSIMDEKHSEVIGYTWESQACYSCHPNGKS